MASKLGERRVKPGKTHLRPPPRRLSQQKQRRQLFLPLQRHRLSLAVFRCFTCGEAGHRQSACPSRTRRGLLIDEVQDDQDPSFEDEQAEEEEEILPDSGQLLIVRHSCFAPKTETQFPQRNKLFQSRCTINGKVCSFVIDSGSSENVIAADAVAKLQLKEEPHPTPYRLAWLQQNHDLIVTKRALVSFSVGLNYKDQAYCDIVPMDACHLLLG